MKPPLAPCGACANTTFELDIIDAVSNERSRSSPKFSGLIIADPSEFDTINYANSRSRVRDMGERTKSGG